MNTQDTARSFWINFTSVSLSSIGSLRYVPRLSTDWRCFLKYFLKFNLLWWVFMCWIYLDGRWGNMNARSPGKSFSYHFFLPMPLHVQTEYVPSQVSTHHNPHCVWPQRSRLGRHPWPSQSSPTHGAHTPYSLRGYITSVQIPLVTDNSFTHRTVQLILQIVQLTGATQILKVFPVSQALSKGDKTSYSQENGSLILEPLSSSL